VEETLPGTARRTLPEGGRGGRESPFRLMTDRQLFRVPAQPTSHRSVSGSSIDHLSAGAAELIRVA